MSRGASIPINVGEKIALDQTARKSQLVRPLVDAAKDLVEGYQHRLSRLIAIDYRLQPDGKMQFHIFPHVPDHREFYPNNQQFANAVEKAVSKIIGKHAEIEAEFHELDGTMTKFDDDGTPREVKQDTRVKAYYRRKDGSINASLLYPNPVPMLWFCINNIPGLMASREQVLELIVDSIVETTENMVSRP